MGRKKPMREDEGPTIPAPAPAPAQPAHASLPQEEKSQQPFQLGAVESAAKKKKKKKKKKEKEKEKKEAAVAVAVSEMEDKQEVTKNDTKGKLTDKKQSKQVREMQERLKKIKEAEERKKKEVEERLRKEEEERLRLEEQEKLAEEKKRLKKEREKEKLLKKKQEGKVMQELNFPTEFISWVMECIKTVSYTILVNGEPTEPFQAAKGLRQGDPMSPFLFAIAMEYFSRCLVRLADVKSFKFHPRCAKMQITHLCFADDLLLFSRGDNNSVQAMMDCFTTFSNASGLQANMKKSCIYFGGVATQEKTRILQSTGFTCGELPFKYLGVPLSTKKISIIQWQPLIKKMTARISSWTSKKLSYAGRLQLIQSVLFGIQAYWAQLFVLPAKVIKLIESYCRSYLWSASNTITKKALVNWSRVCSPICFGGLNLINVSMWNKAAIAKVHWALANKEDRLWIRWVHAYYIKDMQIETMRVPDQACWMIRKIIAARNYLNQFQYINASGNSLTRQIYMHMLTPEPRVGWKNLMYTNAARPRAKFTLWLLLQNKLMTMDRLIKWGKQISPVCCLCNSQDETRDHIFSSCGYGDQIWNRVLCWIQAKTMQPMPWEQHLEEVLARAKGKTQAALAFKMIYTEFVYAVWIERNMRVFEKRSRLAETIARDIAYVCSVRAPPKIKSFMSNFQFS